MDVPHRSRLAEEAVLLALAGGIAVLATLEARGTRDPAIEAALVAAHSTAPNAPLAAWNARELRALPGIGITRAVEIVRARWEGRISGEVDSLDVVRGIGPETVARVRAELERRAHGAAPERFDEPEDEPGGDAAVEEPTEDAEDAPRDTPEEREEETPP